MTMKKYELEAENMIYAMAKKIEQHEISLIEQGIME